MGQISINKTVFDSVVNHAKTAKSALEGIKAIDLSLKETSLKSIQQQIDVIKDFQNVLTLYNELLDLDLNKLQNMGNSMVQQDELLGGPLKN